jgi:hypothetical protein
MPLVKRTPMALEIDCRDLNNRVSTDTGGEFFTVGFQWLRLTFLCRAEPCTSGLQPLCARRHHLHF